MPRPAPDERLDPFDALGPESDLADVELVFSRILARHYHFGMQNQMMACMSQRGAEMLREDMEALGPIKIKDVSAAQQQIIGCSGASVSRLPSRGGLAQRHDGPAGVDHDAAAVVGKKFASGLQRRDALRRTR